MPIVPFFGVGQQGKSHTVTAQHHLNLYAEIAADKSQIAFYGTPGTTLRKSFGDTPVRGWIAVGDLYYLVHRGTMYSVNNAGTSTSLGTLNTTTGRVDLSYSGSVILLVDGTNIYAYDLTYATFFQVEQVSTGTTTSTSAGKLVDSGASFDTDGTKAGMMAYNTTDGTTSIISAVDSATTLSMVSDVFTSGENYSIGPSFVPDGANTCTWLGGQFIVDGGDNSDQFYTSPDGVSWDALDFASAESNPDGLVRVFADNNEVTLAGENTIEYWGNSGGQDFQFSAIQGAAQEFGLAARWSLCKYNSGLAALMKPAMGQVQVMFISGYVPKPISTPEIDYLINNYSTVSDATFYAYMLGGHPMLQCNFPTAGKSWLYDASTGMWSPLEYGLSGARHRGELQLDYLNKTIIADYSTGDIYNLLPDTYTDNGTAIAREIVSRHIFHGNQRIRIDGLYVDMEVGVGLASGQGVNPQVMLQISKTNGAAWGTELWKTIGAIGKYLNRVTWRGLGSARDWLFKLRVTDPVKVVFTFGDLNDK